MSAPLPGDALDRRAVRRAFERAAATSDAVAVLQREVGARMAERLGVLRLAPTAILDAGCGTGEALGELRTRYPGARLVGVDLRTRDGARGAGARVERRDVGSVAARPG